jgi:hypothetical protein
MTRIHLTEEEIYDIFRGIFHNEEDVLAATIQLFSGDSKEWDGLLSAIMINDVTKTRDRTKSFISIYY